MRRRQQRLDDLRQQPPPQSQSKGRAWLPAGQSALQLELESLKISALKRRALAKGVQAGELDAADELTHNRKATIVALVMRQEQDPRVARLTSLSVKALRELALAQGVDPSALDEADDVEDDHRGAIVALIAAKWAAGV